MQFHQLCGFCDFKKMNAVSWLVGWLGCKELFLSLVIGESGRVGVPDFQCEKLKNLNPKVDPTPKPSHKEAGGLGLPTPPQALFG